MFLLTTIQSNGAVTLHRKVRNTSVFREVCMYCGPDSCGDRRTRGAAVRKFQGVGNSTFVLSVENDNDFRSRCE